MNTVFICMDLYEPIIYIQQCYQFLQWNEKKKTNKMAEEDKQTMVHSLSKGNCFSFFFFLPT